MGLRKVCSYHTLNEKIGGKNVFEHYFGVFSLTKSYHSPLRKDAKKSVGFFVSKSGELIYNDFADGVKYNFLQFVSHLLNITEPQAITHIAQTFGLVTGGKQVVAIKPYTPLKKPVKKAITVQIRAFTQLDVQYWQQFNISIAQLKQYKIYSVTSFTIGNYSTTISRDQLCYAYLLFDDKNNGYFKIYQPLNKEHKWFFNGALNLIYGLNLLKFESDTLIITKSVKDFLLLKQYFPDVIALQNESLAASKRNVMLALKQVYKRIIIWADCDRPGIVAANAYKKKYGFTPFFIHYKGKTIWQTLTKVKKLGVKDPSDFVKQCGIKQFNKFLKQNKLCV